MKKIVLLLLSVCISSIAQAAFLRNVEIDSVVYGLYHYDYSFYGGPLAKATVLPSPAYKSMTSITIPEQITINDTVFCVVDIARGAFMGCTNLKRIYLPECLECISENAFYNTGLTELTIPEEGLPSDFRYLDGYRIFYCPDLVTLRVGKTFPEMEFLIKDAFPKIERLEWNSRNCYGSGFVITGSGDDDRYMIGYFWVDVDTPMPHSLSQIVFGPDVEGIPAAFGAGTSIKAVTLPPKLKIIRPNAFNNCQDLVAIHATSTDPTSIELEWSVVEKWAANTAVTLYVPRGTAQRYREAPQWCEFGDRIVEEDFNFDVNQDGLSDVGDLNAFINKVLGISDDALLTTDANRDSSVDIEDVNAVINAMLGK